MERENIDKGDDEEEEIENINVKVKPAEQKRHPRRKGGRNRVAGG